MSSQPTPDKKEFYDRVGQAAELKNRESQAAQSENARNQSTISDGDKTHANAQAESSSRLLQDGEKNSSFTNNFTGGKRALDFKSLVKKRGPLMAVLFLLIGGGISLPMFFAFLGPLAFLTSTMNSLNDSLAAQEIGSNHALRNKVRPLTSAERNQLIAGCGKMSIRCKFRTMSNAQMAKLELAGELRVEGSRVAGGLRTIPETITDLRTNRVYTAAEFYDLLGSSNNSTEARAIRQSAMRGLNMSYLGLTTERVKNYVMKRYNITRKAPELRGTHYQRVAALAARAGVTRSNLADIRFVQVDGSDPPRYVMAQDASDSPRQFTENQRDRMQRTINREVRFGSAFRAIGSTVNVLGVADMACTYRNLVNAAGVTAKVAVQTSSIVQASGLLAAAGAWQADDASDEDVSALMEVFNSTDTREYIPDVYGAGEGVVGEDLYTEVSTGEVTAIYEDGEEATVETTGFRFDSDAVIKNPNYGKSMMDNALYEWSETGTLSSTDGEEFMAYSLGVSESRLMSMLGGFAGFAQGISSVLNSTACGAIQQWWVRGLGTVAGVITAPLTLSRAAIQGAWIAGIFVATQVLQWQIDRMIADAQSHLTFDEDVTLEELDETHPPSHRATQAWVGATAIQTSQSQLYGLAPAGIEQSAAYRNLNQETKIAYDTAMTEVADAFDMTNYHSFINRFGRSIAAYGSTQTPQAIVSNTFSIVSSASASLLAPQVGAATDRFNDSYFGRCDDRELLQFNDLAVGPMCNIHYYMPEEDLALTIDQVNDFMEDNGYVEIDPEIGESITGLPAGYTPPSEVESRNAVESLVLDGMVGAFYNTRSFGDTVNGQLYGKFLDYCVYRALPFGDTFAETGAWGSAERGWVTGANCMVGDQPDQSLTSSEKNALRYFRMYTLYNATHEAMDEEDTPLTAFAPFYDGIEEETTIAQEDTELDMETINVFIDSVLGEEVSEDALDHGLVFIDDFKKDTNPSSESYLTTVTHDIIRDQNSLKYLTGRKNAPTTA